MVMLEIKGKKNKEKSNKETERERECVPVQFGWCFDCSHGSCRGVAAGTAMAVQVFWLTVV